MDKEIYDRITKNGTQDIDGHTDYIEKSDQFEFVKDHITKRINEVGRLHIAILDQCDKIGKDLSIAIETRRWKWRHPSEKIQYVYDNTDIIEELEQQIEYEPYEGIFKEKWLTRILDRYMEKKLLEFRYLHFRFINEIYKLVTMETKSSI